VKIVGLVELSGPGATSGSHFKAGMGLAAKEINAAGGILGRPIALEFADTQTTPGVAKALAIKAVDDGAYVVLGPIFSGSVLVSMEELKRAEVVNLVGGEATAITRAGNPYVFRTSFSQANAMPGVARYIAQDMKARSVAVVYVNNDFGKGGRDAIVADLERRGVKIAADISTDQGQLDFSAPALRAKQSGADVLFVYLNVDESARILRELRKQGYDKPIIGETTIMQQSVIDLTGEAAAGVRGHVGLTIDAPIAAVKAYAEKFEREYKFKSSHRRDEGLHRHVYGEGGGGEGRQRRPQGAGAGAEECVLQCEADPGASHGPLLRRQGRPRSGELPGRSQGRQAGGGRGTAAAAGKVSGRTS
jgi:branched-chain amino acid transport system substrate-binding protein